MFFVHACGWALFPGVGFMVMGSGCLCWRLVVVRGRIGSHWQGDFTTGNGTDPVTLTAWMDQAGLDGVCGVCVCVKRCFKSTAPEIAYVFSALNSQARPAVSQISCFTLLKMLVISLAQYFCLLSSPHVGESLAKCCTSNRSRWSIP